MQSLTKVVLHPVTTTLVPAVTALLFKAMDLTLVLQVKAGLT
jgi:hypothetical protein